MRFFLPSILKRTVCVGTLCLVAAYVALLPQFYLVYQSGNRYSLDWSPTARTSLFIAIGILAAAYAIVYGLLLLLAAWIDRRQSRVDARRWLLDAALCALLVLVIRSGVSIAEASEELPRSLARAVNRSTVQWILYLIVPVGLMAAFRRPVERGILHLYRMLTILFALFLVQMCFWNFYAPADGLTETSPADKGLDRPGNLYLFLFDCWSYPETFGSDRFDLAHMPHLSALLEQATLFHQAYSPGIETTVSIPRFLFQTEPRMADLSYREVVDHMNANRFPQLGMSSIFDLSDSHHKLIVSSILHYADFIGTQVDSIVPFYSPQARYFLKERVADLLRTECSFLRKIGIPIPKPSNETLSMHEWGRHTRLRHQQRIRPILNDILPRLPPRNIALFHIFLPHPPFAFTRDWSPRRNPFRPDPDGLCFLENVYAMDVVIGDIVQHLKARGEYEDSLLVFFSDHAQRDGDQSTWEERDTTVYSADKHTPLIIKYPGQTRGRDLHQRIVTSELHPLFRAYLQTPDALRDWVAQWDAGTASEDASPGHGISP